MGLDVCHTDAVSDSDILDVDIDGIDIIQEMGGFLDPFYVGGVNSASGPTLVGDRKQNSPSRKGAQKPPKTTGASVAKAQIDAQVQGNKYNFWGNPANDDKMTMSFKIAVYVANRNISVYICIYICVCIYVNCCTMGDCTTK